MVPSSSQGSVASTVHDEVDPGSGYPIVRMEGRRKVYLCPRCEAELPPKRLCNGTKRPQNKGRTFTLCFDQSCVALSPKGNKFFWFFDLVAPGVEWISSPAHPVHPSLLVPFGFTFQPPGHAPTFPPALPARTTISPTSAPPASETTQSTSPELECRYPGCHSTRVRRKPKPCGQLMCTKHCRIAGGCSEHGSSALQNQPLPTSQPNAPLYLSGASQASKPLDDATFDEAMSDTFPYPATQQADPPPSQPVASTSHTPSYARPLCNDWQREMARVASEAHRETFTKKQRLSDAALVNITIVLFLSDDKPGDRMATNLADDIYPFLRLTDVPVLVSVLKAKNVDLSSVIKIYNNKKLYWEYIDFASFVVDIKSTCCNDLLILALPSVMSFGRHLDDLIMDAVPKTYNSQKITPAKPPRYASPTIVPHVRSPSPSHSPSAIPYVFLFKLECAGPVALMGLWGQCCTKCCIVPPSTVCGGSPIHFQPVQKPVRTTQEWHRNKGKTTTLTKRIA